MTRRRDHGEWIRVDQAFWLDPKLRRCSVPARYLFFVLIGYSKQASLDGHVPMNVLPLLAVDIPDGHVPLVTELLREHLVERNGADDLNIPKFLKWQHSAAEIEELRAAGRERAAASAARRKAAKENHEPS